MLNKSRGTITVPQRDLRDPDRPETGERVEFPIGEDLLDAVRSQNSNSRLYESTAIKRYAQSVGVDLRDVIDVILDGEDFGSMKVQRFLTNTGLRPLFSPVVEDGLRLGLNRIAAQWQDLIARTVQVDSLTYEYYEFSNGTPNASNPGQPTGTGEFSLRQIGQGAQIPTARVSISGKSYTLFKQGRGIEWTDESKMAPIDLAAAWFQQVGIQLGWDYHDQIFDMLLNGYFDDGSDDAPVLATNVAGVIDDADLYTAVGTLQQVYGYTATVMMMSLARSVAIRTMENGAGQRLFPSGVEGAGLPPIRIAATIPNDKIVFADTDFAILRLVNKEFGTEFDRSVQTQVEGSYGTSIEIFVPLFKNARLILDS
jgi:hypothetical protein